MSTVTELHPFTAAREAGREPFKVKDLGLADFGRKEIRPAEHEMPGLMALRAEYRGRFSSLRFSTRPDNSIDQRFFVAGTPRIYAIWDYANMDQTLSMGRFWQKNGEDWITREENWNLSEYDRNGTINDISIYDEDVGLETGEY